MRYVGLSPSGEPGIGKSRLTVALQEHLKGEPHTRMQYFCSPQHTDSAFYPVIAQLERAAAFERRSGQSDSEEVMSSPTPYRNVTMFPGGSLHTRQIRRNASQAEEQFHVTRHCRAGGGTQRGTRVIGDCCGGVRNSSRTCIREPLTAVWAGTLNSWMMRKSFRFASIALNRRSFQRSLRISAPSLGLELSGRGSSCIV